MKSASRRHSLLFRLAPFAKRASDDEGLYQTKKLKEDISKMRKTRRPTKPLDRRNWNLLGAHSRYGRHVLSSIGDTLSEGPADCRLERSPEDLDPLPGKRRLVTVPAGTGHRFKRRYYRGPFSSSESLLVSPRVLLPFAVSLSACASVCGR